MKSKIHGLRMMHAAKQARLSKAIQKAADVDASDRDRHDAKSSLPGLQNEVSAIGKAIDENEAMIDRIELLIADLKQSSNQSPDRSLCLRKLEAASDRLRREIGDHA
jgi:hypothetical protein